MTKVHKIISVAIFLAILTGLYFFDRSRRQQIAIGTPTNQTIATSTNGNTIINSKGNYTVEQVPINEGRGVPQPIPDLSRPIRPPGSAVVSPEAVTLATEKIKGLQTSLKKNPADFSAWLDLGMYQKMAGDYQGTVLSWQYASKLAPSDYISLGNLGDLYAYFIKDNAQAESYYKKAIANGPTQEYLYTQLVIVYRDIFKDNTKALALMLAAA